MKKLKINFRNILAKYHTLSGKLCYKYNKEGWFLEAVKNTIFLRAQRQSDGKRTFQLIEEKPLQTSFGKDLYNEVFGIGD